MSERICLVLLPGLDGTAELFRLFIDALGASVDTLPIGYPRNERLGYDELIALVRPLLPTDQPFLLLGESFSGPLAIRLAAESPPGLRGLVLCCTFAGNPFPWLRLIAWLSKVVPICTSPRWLYGYMLLGRFATPPLTDWLIRTVKQTSPAVIRHRIGALLAVNAYGELAKVQAPILALRARDDRVIWRSSLRRICAVRPDVQVLELPAPHMLLQAMPREAAEAVKKFIGQQTGDGRQERELGAREFGS